MAGYIGTKAVSLSTTAADVTGDAEIGGDLTVSGALTSTGIDDNATSTAMTLDSSGNLLVGKTVASSSGEGVQLEGTTGQIVAVSDGQFPLFLNRLSSDGDIAQFRKDGALMGSAQADAGYFNIGSGTTRLDFVDSSPKRVIPRAGHSAVSNGEIDLGDAGSRFKDLYLQGSIDISGGLKFDYYRIRPAFAVGYNTTVDTGISVNGGHAGRGLLVMMTGHTSDQFNTQSALYLVRCPYNGDHTPVGEKLGGNYTITVGKSASNTITLHSASIPVYQIMEISVGI